MRGSPPSPHEPSTPGSESSTRLRMARSALARSPLQWGLRQLVHPTPAWTAMGVRPPRRTGFHPVRYQSRPSMTLWKTQCAQRIQSWLNACPWNVTASTERAMELCWPWCPFWANGRLSPGCLGKGRVWGVGAGSPRLSPPPDSCPCQRWQRLADMMGSLRVKGTAAPEVKFLDRRKTNSGAGVLQGRVRRSRARAWGSKMIRHRRSPGP